MERGWSWAVSFPQVSVQDEMWMPPLIHDLTGPQDSGGLLIWGKVLHFSAIIGRKRIRDWLKGWSLFLQQPLGFSELSKQGLPSRSHLTEPQVGWKNCHYDNLENRRNLKPKGSCPWQGVTTAVHSLLLPSTPSNVQREGCLGEMRSLNSLMVLTFQDLYFVATLKKIK